MTTETPRRWILADLDPLIAAAGRLVAGTASERDRRLVRKYLHREGELALWQVGQTDGRFTPAKAGVERVGATDQALGRDLHDAVWRALSALGRGHFGLVVAATAGHIEFSPTDPIGLVLLEMGRALGRLEPVEPEVRSAACAHCLAPMPVTRRHPNGEPVRRYCSARCRAAANYRARRLAVTAERTA